MAMFWLSNLQDKIAEELKGTGIFLPDSVIDGIYKLYTKEKACFTDDFLHDDVEHAIIALHFDDVKIMNIAIRNKVTDVVVALFEIKY